MLDFEIKIKIKNLSYKHNSMTCHFHKNIEKLIPRGAIRLDPPNKIKKQKRE